MDIDNMTPEQINRFLAERLMSYKWSEGWGWLDEKGLPNTLGVVGHNYAPYSDHIQAVEALLAFWQRGWDCELELLNREGRHIALLTVERWANRDETQTKDSTSTGEIAPIICRTIVAAIMAEKEQREGQEGFLAREGAGEDLLTRTWDTPEENEAWKDL